MGAGIKYDEVEVGTELPSQSVELPRLRLVMYAGASGDFNVIHWNERIAKSVGLPDVIAHGMLTLAVALRAVTDWSGDASAVVDCGGRFAKPVVVPDDDKGVELVVEGVVAELLADRRVRVELTVRCGGEKVLTRTRAVVALG